MQTKLCRIDKNGRVKLPAEMLKAFGFLPNTDIIVKLTDNGIFIKPKRSATPITEQIANMELPVAEWDELEADIEKGHL